MVVYPRWFVTLSRVIHVNTPRILRRLIVGGGYWSDWAFDVLTFYESLMPINYSQYIYWTLEK